MSQLRFDVNLSILFTELPLLQRPAAARRAGFDAVEFWWPWPVAVPSDAEVDAFVAAVRDAGVQLVGLNFFAGDMPGGDRGLVSWPARSAEFRDNVDVTVGIGERLGCRAFNALYGNRVDGVDPAAQDEHGAAQLALAARAGRDTSPRSPPGMSPAAKLRPTSWTPASETAETNASTSRSAGTAVSNGHQNSTASKPASRAAAGRSSGGSSVNSSEQLTA